MFERLSYLYNTGKITKGQLDIAVSKGWITVEEKTQIIG
ncbi:XkdX family protein [Ruminiclostridium josui]|nr:XkdX family protein [Ruminiclostridium josui]